MATTISTQDLENARRDIDDIGKAVNEKVIVSPRYGEDFKSIPMLAAEAQGKINEWQNAINTITVGNGVPALAVSDASGVTQQDINDLTGAPYRAKAGGYNIGERVVLDNGDIVRSTVAGNTANPNVDMTGWMYDGYVYKNYHLVSKWGAKGDGVTQDRIAIQAAIDDLHAIYMSTGIVQTLIYEDNKKYVCHSVAIKEGVNHVSIGQSTLLKTPALPAETEADLKWRNIFYPIVDANSILKDRILIENLVFDGNYNNMNWTWDTYNQQQGGNLYMHSSAIPSGKRLKYELRNVVLKDSVGDGVLVSKNTDVIIRGLKAEDCFRGGVTIVGGNSIIDMDGMIGENANLHIELDGGGNDTDTPYKIIGSFKNISIDKDRGLNAPWGGFYYTTSAGSDVYLDNVKVFSRNFHVESATVGSDLTRDFPSSAKFHNCHFVVSGGSRVFFPRGMNFHNCTFKYKMLDDATADNNGMHWYWRTTSGNAPNGQISNFYDCKFIGDTVNGFKFLSAFHVSSTPNSAYGFLNAYRCTFSGFRYGFYAPYGFRGEHHDCIYDSETGVLVGSTTLVGGGSLKFKLKNPTFTKNCTLALSILEELKDGTTELEFVDVSIDRSKLNQANLPTINGALKGFLEVISNVAPNPLSTSVDTLWGGTRWKVLANATIPIYEYINTAANGVKNKDTWLAAVFVTKTGNTATRPTLAKFDVGVTYFNTETSKVEFWNGSAWV